MNSSFSIQTYSSHHKQSFKNLNLEWIEKYFRVEKKDLQQVENPEECLENGGQIFFILQDGQVAGTCAVYRLAAGLYEIAKMAVAPTWQGHGLGDALMKTAEEWAWSQGAEEILILSNTVLKPAITLYKKHGYEVVNLGPHPDYDRCNIEMRKRRDPSARVTSDSL